jgi:hypothetical protein
MLPLLIGLGEAGETALVAEGSAAATESAVGGEIAKAVAGKVTEKAADGIMDWLLKGLDEESATIGRAGFKDMTRWETIGTHLGLHELEVDPIKQAKRYHDLDASTMDAVLRHDEPVTDREFGMQLLDQYRRNNDGKTMPVKEAYAAISLHRADETTKRQAGDAENQAEKSAILATAQSNMEIERAKQRSADAGLNEYDKRRTLQALASPENTKAALEKARLAAGAAPQPFFDDQIQSLDKQIGDVKSKEDEDSKHSEWVINRPMSQTFEESRKARQFDSRKNQYDTQIKNLEEKRKNVEALRNNATNIQVQQKEAEVLRRSADARAALDEQNALDRSLIDPEMVTAEAQRDRNRGRTNTQAEVLEEWQNNHRIDELRASEEGRKATAEGRFGQLASDLAEGEARRRELRAHNPQPASFTPGGQPNLGQPIPKPGAFGGAAATGAVDSEELHSFVMGQNMIGGRIGQMLRGRAEGLPGADQPPGDRTDLGQPIPRAGEPGRDRFGRPDSTGAGEHFGAAGLHGGAGTGGGAEELLRQQVSLSQLQYDTLRDIAASVRASHDSGGLHHVGGN